LKIEKKFSLSKPATTTKKNYLKKIYIFASFRTRFLPRRRTVKTRPRGKRGRVRTSGR
jgi:hypothetical protein